MSPSRLAWMPQWASALSSPSIDMVQPNQCLVAQPWLCSVAILIGSTRPHPVTGYGFRCPVEENLCQAYGAHRAKAPMVKVPALPDQAAPPLVVGAALGFNPEIQPLKTGFRFSWKAANPSA